MPQVKPILGAPLNRASPYAAGLIGCWLFNEGSGIIAYDSSGMNNHGTLTNMANPPTATSGWTSGPNGEALAFDNNNDAIKGIPKNILFLNDFTIIARINVFSTGLNGGGRIVDNGRVILLVGALGVIRLSVTGGGGLSTSGNDAYVLNRFSTVATTYKAGNTATMYSNGALSGVADQVIGANAAGVTLTTIGNRAAEDRQFDGLISDVMIWNRVLSAQEISYLHAFPYCMFHGHGGA